MRYPATHHPLELARALVKLPNSSPLRYLSSCYLYSDITCGWLEDCWTVQSPDPLLVMRGNGSRDPQLWNYYHLLIRIGHSSGRSTEECCVWLANKVSLYNTRWMMVSLFYLLCPGTTRLDVLSCSVQRNQRFCHWWMDAWVPLMNYEMVHSCAFGAEHVVVFSDTDTSCNLLHTTGGGDRPVLSDWLVSGLVPASQTETTLLVHRHWSTVGHVVVCLQQHIIWLIKRVLLTATGQGLPGLGTTGQWIEIINEWVNSIACRYWIY